MLAEVRRLRAAVEPYLRLSLMHPMLNDETAGQHRELVDVMLTRNPELAEATMCAITWNRLPPISSHVALPPLG